MPKATHVPAELSGQVFRGSQACGQGSLTRPQLRSGPWRRLIRDVYADARLDSGHDLVLHAASLVVPPEAVFCRVSAAWLYGVRLVGESEPVHVRVPRDSHFHRYQGLRVYREDRPASQLRHLAGFPVTTADRTALDFARGPDLVLAVGQLDAMLHAGVVELAEVWQALRESPTIRGFRRAERALALADGRAESPLESRGRLVLVLGGLPVPEVQYEIRRGDSFVARLDLAYPEARLGIEIDGVWHAASTQLARDRQRLNRIMAAGWTVLDYTAGDLYRRPEEVVAEVRRHLSARAAAS